MIKFHLLNVGHGDCTFVELPSGRLMLIDINNSKSLSETQLRVLASQENMTLDNFRRFGSYSLNKSWEEYYEGLLVDPVEYHRNVLGSKDIFRYIQTHPDMDHMSGINRLFFEEKINLYNFWNIKHSKTKTKEDFENSSHDYSDWLAYMKLTQGSGPNDLGTNNKSIKVINNLRFSSSQYWADDSIDVLSPSISLRDTEDAKSNWNNISYVLRFSHGGRTVILAGDAEKEAWDSIIEDVNKTALSCDVLKAAHHGRKSGYHEPAVDIMNPSVVIASIGKKPESDAHNDYKNKGADVFSTRSKGTITATIWDDGELWIDDSFGNRLKTLPALRTN